MTTTSCLVAMADRRGHQAHTAATARLNALHSALANGTAALPCDLARPVLLDLTAGRPPLALVYSAGVVRR
jgi:hypothetical protein